MELWLVNLSMDIVEYDSLIEAQEIASKLNDYCGKESYIVLNFNKAWQDLQEAAKLINCRFYGSTGTIHNAGSLDVELGENGEVVSVWFGCQPLPFTQHKVDKERADSMKDMSSKLNCKIGGVMIQDGN